ncbi:hypothetical protein KDA_35780 [Dictyobacter alpinus]|uniref:Uncharacterized protein n=2 Tax=Dictyobacter alpinus TaxID=2014873 RepID=A0A402B9P3_9CHLR|nr:hypothetical protein KDA_35780 [Dictyobacter alpinus]
MSLFSDIANTIGHTVESLATSVGVDASMLETIVNELDGNGVDVFSFSARLGLSVEAFLSGIVNLMRGDPHQLLLQRLTGPAKPLDTTLSLLAQQWAQAASLHQDTAQAIDAHMKELFQGSGTASSYDGPGAESLLKTHQDYHKYFTVLIEHAQTQHMYHATLEGHVNAYLSQAPGSVYSLSAPMAALSVLTLDTATMSPPPSVLDDPVVQGVEQAIEWVAVTGEQAEQEDGDPTEGTQFIIFIVLVIVLVVLVIVLVLVVLGSMLYDELIGYQTQQKNTLPTPVPPPGVGPGPSPLNLLTPEQQRLHNDVVSRLGYTTLEIDELIKAGYLDPDAIAAIIKGGIGTFTVFNDPNTAKMMNELTTAQQLKFIGIAELYQATHPGLTSAQVQNYLSYMKMKGQGQQIYNELTSTDPNSLARRYAVDTQRMLDRFNKDFWNPITSVTDPFTFTNAQIEGSYKYLVGFWGEWASVKLADANHQLVHFGVPIAGGEVDIQEKDGSGNPLKWIEIKNGSVKSNWRSALKQVQNYINQGATEVVIQLPQQGKPGYPLPGAQQIQNIQDIKNVHPAIVFDVVVATPTDAKSLKDLQYLENKFKDIHFKLIPPASSIPYDPPAGDWGSLLP